MKFSQPLTVLALASLPLGCPSDTTPATDDSSGTTENDDDNDDNDDNDNDDDDPTDDPTNDPDSSSTDPTDPTDASSSSTDPTDASSSSTDPTDPTDASSSSTDPTDPTDDSSSTAGESSESSSSTTDTAGDDCAQFEIVGDLQAVGQGNVFRFTAADISGASDDQVDDFLQFEFYADNTGVFDLSVAPDDNYDSCENCLLVYEDVVKGDAARFFFQSQGTLTIDGDSSVLGGGLFYGSISGVRLVEVTIDPDTFTSTPVDDGLCIDLVDGDVGTIDVPDAWTCSPTFYGTGLADDCDCGCGVVDPDCIDMTAGSCDFCNNEGACSEGGGACPSNIDPVDNSQCTMGMDESQDLVAGPGLDVDVPDDDYDGTVGSMACVTLPLAAAGASDTVTGAQLVLGMSHTWIGDLVVKVISPENTIVTVLSRPGFVEPADDGVLAGPGDTADLVFGSPITYVNGGATDAETMGSTLAGFDDIVCEDDGLCIYDPNPGFSATGDFSAFVGESAVGDWQVCVGDGAGGDLGVIDAVTLTVDQG